MNRVFVEPQQDEVEITNDYDDCGSEALNAGDPYCIIQETETKKGNNTEEKVEEDTNKTEEKSKEEESREKKEYTDSDTTEKFEAISDDNLKHATEKVGQAGQDEKEESILNKKGKGEMSEESNKMVLAEANKNREKSPLKMLQAESNDLTPKWPQERTPIKTGKVEAVLSPFSRHLRFPEPIKKGPENRKKEKLPSAISSKAWRKHIEKQEQKKISKLEVQQKKK